MRREHVHHGAQLAVSVVLAYLVSAGLGLPEHFWAVMSTLIVMRPDADMTLDAGWDRVRGTLVGAVCGLAGVGLIHVGAPALPTTLAIVCLVAFASAAAAWLRSAAVAALIILAASDLAGHSAREAALLRVAQILIGVGVAMAVAMVFSRVRATARLDAACVALLRRLAQLLATTDAAAPSAETLDSAGALRVALGRLTLLADGADKAERHPWRRLRHADPQHHRRLVSLVGRVVQDVTVLKRLLRDAAPGGRELLTFTVIGVAAKALLSVSASVERGEAADLTALGQLAEELATPRPDAAADNSEPARLLAGPLRLLLNDLHHISRLEPAAPLKRQAESPG
jgi:uncharacterized membrane protein YccC